MSDSSPSTFSLWTSSRILIVAASPLIIDLNCSGVGFGVAARTFCTEVGESGNPHESMVAMAIFAPSSVRSLHWKDSLVPRLRCPGKCFAACSGDEMCIGMGRGAEDAMVVRDSEHDMSEVDIADGPQV